MTTYYRRAPGSRPRRVTHHIASTATGRARCGVRCEGPTWEATEEEPGALGGYERTERDDE